MIYANLKPYDPTVGTSLNEEFKILENGRYALQLIDIKHKSTIDGVEKEVYWFKVLDEAYYGIKVFLTVFIKHRNEKAIIVSQNLLANFINVTGNDLSVDTRNLIGSIVLADITKYKVKEKVDNTWVETDKFANNIIMFAPYIDEPIEEQEQNDDDGIPFF